MSDSVIVDSEGAALALNCLAREQMKLRLLHDIRIDLAVCDIEGWDKLEYIRDLQEAIDVIAAGTAGGDHHT